MKGIVFILSFLFVCSAMAQAEYYIQAPGIENDNTFFYTAPCDAMGQFCQYVSLPRENVPDLYSLEN